MLVAVWDQSTGTSTSRCSKITAPLSLPMEAVRSSHVNSSYGVLPGSSLEVKYLGKLTPNRFATGTGRFASLSFIATPTLNCPMGISWYQTAVGNLDPTYSSESRFLSIYGTLTYETAQRHHSPSTKRDCCARIGSWL